ncbi:hypothetical protein NSQ93_22515 [Bacillus sp. FSL W8-0445]|uniref:hypothetical protein n=1 Tax=Bacillota TaxID=1239 RepID=UPI0007797820|nr:MULTISPECIES: hypothetical protein [Bacillota]KYC77051.1 hypothetical protein B4092_4788 [Bacillus licheniformis]MDE1407016.1 hypothetical protein [Bacillus licheniformis]NFT30585.1 hypothetical protein [Clostridium sporogenes]OJT57334.1 hypothetical protein BFP47_11535 [Bacillus licheniformis]OJT70024.1 hypothetical protein BFP46_05355 [Bacillus licheniformis]
MNEILVRKHVKKIMKYGIPREMAKEIVLTAYESGREENIELYINYAIDLTYGLGFSKKEKYTS